tara:strand:- start:242 stop:739 length:498 start_codon:yes stop_codon:yes gene_type:complete
MKITKQRLKEIIREEVGAVEEGTFGLTRARHAAAQEKLASLQNAKKVTQELFNLWKTEKDPKKKEKIRQHIQALADAANAITEEYTKDEVSAILRAGEASKASASKADDLSPGALLNDITALADLADGLRSRIQKAAFRNLEQHPQVREAIRSLEETKILLESIK